MNNALYLWRETETATLIRWLYRYIKALDHTRVRARFLDGLVLAEANATKQWRVRDASGRLASYRQTGKRIYSCTS